VIDQNGGKRWRWLAEPFGTTAPETNPDNLGAFGFNLRFPGQYADQESGLFYNYFRYYAPDNGIYRQSDPIGLAGGSLSTYLYVVGDPLTFVDPDGLAGKVPKNYGKDKPMTPPPTADEIKKMLEQKQEPGQNFADNLKCLFSFKNCDLEIELKKTRRCLVARCTSTCPPSTFTVDYRTEQVAYDPETTTCECQLWGLNPDYQGGPPPGLTAPGR